MLTHEGNETRHGCAAGSGRYATPGRCNSVTACGTRASPKPADTRLTIVCIWIACCAITGVAPWR